MATPEGHRYRPKPTAELSPATRILNRQYRGRPIDTDTMTNARRQLSDELDDPDDDDDEEYHSAPIPSSHAVPAPDGHADDQLGRGATGNSDRDCGECVLPGAVHGFSESVQNRNDPSSSALDGRSTEAPAADGAAPPIITGPLVESTSQQSYHSDATLNTNMTPEAVSPSGVSGLQSLGTLPGLMSTGTVPPRRESRSASGDTHNSPPLQGDARDDALSETEPRKYTHATPLQHNEEGPLHAARTPLDTAAMRSPLSPAVCSDSTEPYDARLSPPPPLVAGAASESSEGSAGHGIPLPQVFEAALAQRTSIPSAAMSSVVCSSSAVSADGRCASAEPEDDPCGATRRYGDASSSVLRPAASSTSGASSDAPPVPEQHSDSPVSLPPAGPPGPKISTPQQFVPESNVAATSNPPAHSHQNHHQRDGDDDGSFYRRSPAFDSGGSSMSAAGSSLFNLRMQISEQFRHAEETAHVEATKGGERQVRAEALLLEAQPLRDAGQYLLAIAVLNEAIDEDPTNPRVFTERGRCALELGQFEEALRDADTAIELETLQHVGQIHRVGRRLKTSILRSQADRVEDIHGTDTSDPRFYGATASVPPPIGSSSVHGASFGSTSSKTNSTQSHGHGGGGVGAESSRRGSGPAFRAGKARRHSSFAPHSSHAHTVSWDPQEAKSDLRFEKSAAHPATANEPPWWETCDPALRGGPTPPPLSDDARPFDSVTSHPSAQSQSTLLRSSLTHSQSMSQSSLGHAAIPSAAPSSSSKDEHSAGVGALPLSDAVAQQQQAAIAHFLRSQRSESPEALHSAGTSATSAPGGLNATSRPSKPDAQDERMPASTVVESQSTLPVPPTQRRTPSPIVFAAVPSQDEDRGNDKRDNGDDDDDSEESEDREEEEAERVLSPRSWWANHGHSPGSTIPGLRTPVTSYSASHSTPFESRSYAQARVASVKPQLHVDLNFLHELEQDPRLFLTRAELAPEVHKAIAVLRLTEARPPPFLHRKKERQRRKERLRQLKAYEEATAKEAKIRELQWKMRTGRGGASAKRLEQEADTAARAAAVQATAAALAASGQTVPSDTKDLLRPGMSPSPFRAHTAVFGRNVAPPSPEPLTKARYGPSARQPSIMKARDDDAGAGTHSNSSRHPHASHAPAAFRANVCFDVESNSGGSTAPSDATARAVAVAQGRHATPVWLADQARPVGAAQRSLKLFTAITSALRPERLRRESRAGDAFYSPRVRELLHQKRDEEERRRQREAGEAERGLGDESFVGETSVRADASRRSTQLFSRPTSAATAKQQQHDQTSNGVQPSPPPTRPMSARSAQRRDVALSPSVAHHSGQTKVPSVVDAKRFAKMTFCSHRRADPRDAWDLHAAERARDAAQRSEERRRQTEYFRRMSPKRRSQSRSEIEEDEENSDDTQAEEDDDDGSDKNGGNDGDATPRPSAVFSGDTTPAASRRGSCLPTDLAFSQDFAASAGTVERTPLSRRGSEAQPGDGEAFVSPFFKSGPPSLGGESGSGASDGEVVDDSGSGDDAVLEHIMAQRRATVFGAAESSGRDVKPSAADSKPVTPQHAAAVPPTEAVPLKATPPKKKSTLKARSSSPNGKTSPSPPKRKREKPRAASPPSQGQRRRWSWEVGPSPFERPASGPFASPKAKLQDRMRRDREFKARPKAFNPFTTRYDEDLKMEDGWGQFPQMSEELKRRQVEAAHRDKPPEPRPQYVAPPPRSSTTREDSLGRSQLSESQSRQRWSRSSVFTPPDDDDSSPAVDAPFGRAQEPDSSRLGVPTAGQARRRSLGSESAVSDTSGGIGRRKSALSFAGASLDAASCEQAPPEVGHDGPVITQTPPTPQYGQKGTATVGTPQEEHKPPRTPRTPRTPKAPRPPVAATRTPTKPATPKSAKRPPPLRMSPSSPLHSSPIPTPKPKRGVTASTPKRAPTPKHKITPSTPKPASMGDASPSPRTVTASGAGASSLSPQEATKTFSQVVKAALEESKLKGLQGVLRTRREKEDAEAKARRDLGLLCPDLVKPQQLESPDTDAAIDHWHVVGCADDADPTDTDRKAERPDRETEYQEAIVRLEGVLSRLSASPGCTERRLLEEHAAMTPRKSVFAKERSSVGSVGGHGGSSNGAPTSPATPAPRKRVALVGVPDSGRTSPAPSEMDDRSVRFKPRAPSTLGSASVSAKSQSRLASQSTSARGSVFKRLSVVPLPTSLNFSALAREARARKSLFASARSASTASVTFSDTTRSTDTNGPGSISTTSGASNASASVPGDGSVAVGISIRRRLISWRSRSLSRSGAARSPSRAPLPAPAIPQQASLDSTAGSDDEFLGYDTEDDDVGGLEVSFSELDCTAR